MSDTFDAVVIGAGAAGLAAGTRLHRFGLGVMVLEAAGRIGGRAHTDTSSLGVAWDRGCHWLHSASVNPLRKLADELGIAYLQRGSRQARDTHLGTRWASEDERNAVWAAIRAGFDAVTQAGLGDRDIAASEVIDRATPWLLLTRHWLSLMSAADPEHISTRDFAAYADTGENYPVEQGYGALVAAVAKAAAPDLALTLDCPVTRIDWSGTGVALETPRGTVKARIAILTVPTSVIANGRIAFAPVLPVELAEAFAALPLGAAEKVALRFDRDVFGVAPTTYSDTIDLDNATRAPINFTLNPFGHSMAIGQLAGENAAGLVAAGPAAMVDFGVRALVDAFGSDITARITGTATTNWITDPLIGGAYSCALPGLAHMRARLAASLEDKVLFAGEAVSADAYSTAHGAHLTGIAAADRAVALLGRAAA